MPLTPLTSEEMERFARTLFSQYEAQLIPYLFSLAELRFVERLRADGPAEPLAAKIQAVGEIQAFFREVADHAGVPHDRGIHSPRGPGD